MKLNKRTRSVVKMPCGSEFAFTGKPIDGKPGLLVELPEGATILHHKLTSPDKRAYDSA